MDSHIKCETHRPMPQTTAENDDTVKSKGSFSVPIASSPVLSIPAPIFASVPVGTTPVTSPAKLAEGGWPGAGGFIFAGMGIVERISLRYFSGKYREGGGCP